jgi:hypothetical protein
MPSAAAAGLARGIAIWVGWNPEDAVVVAE